MIGARELIFWKLFHTAEFVISNRHKSGRLFKLTSAQLQDFIHACMFTGKTFQKAEITGPDGKLNKTSYQNQTAKDIERNDSK